MEKLAGEKRSRTYQFRIGQIPIDPQPFVGNGDWEDKGFLMNFAARFGVNAIVVFYPLEYEDLRFDPIYLDIGVFDAEEPIS